MVVEVSVGVVHVLVLLETGEVYSWGKKEYAHSAEAMPPSEEPSHVLPLANTQIIGIAAGPTQVKIIINSNKNSRLYNPSRLFLQFQPKITCI